MTKEKLYQIVQALFLSELGVGDIVESPLGNNYAVLQVTEHALFCENNVTIPRNRPHKLIRKNITAEDILTKFQTVRKFHTTLELSNKGYLTYWESTTDVVKQEDWILGKPLYDQSIELIRLVWEILK